MDAGKTVNKGRQNDSGPFKIAVISIAHLCHDIFTSFLSPILPLLIEKLALSYAAAGFISVLIRIPSLFSPVVGAFFDRRTLKHLVILSPTVTAAAMCLMGVAPNYYAIALLALITGVSSTCFHVPSPVVIHEVAGKRVGAAMSAFQIGGELSRTVGPLVVLFALSLWTFEGLYRLIPFGMAASFFLYKIFGAVEPSSDSAQSHVRGRVLETLNGARRLFTGIFGILLCKSLTASVLAAFLPTYLTVHGKSLWLSGSALALLQGAAVAGVFISGTLSDRIGCERVLLLLTCGTPLMMLLFVFSGGWMTVACLVLLGITAFSSTPVLLSLVQKHGFSSPATANGIYMTINFMLSSLSVLLAGAVSDMVGIGMTFKLCAACSWVGLPCVWMLKNGAGKQGK